MTRLVAFGCSITYGHGLPDCFEPPIGFGKEPSKYAWPSLLAKKLQREAINLSSPGSGNLEILYKLLQYKFEKDDLCVIYWSFYDRIDLVRLHPKLEKIYRLRLENIDKEFLSESGYLTHTDVRNYMLIHHAGLYLEKIGVPYFFLDRASQNTNTLTIIPPFLQLKNHDTTKVDKYFRIDYALDNMHPGIESQKKIANYMYNHITKKSVISKFNELYRRNT